MTNKDVIQYNLAEALAGATCPVCRCIAEATRRFLDNLMYEFVNDNQTRDRLRATKGFCREHAWTLQKMGILWDILSFMQIWLTLSANTWRKRANRQT